MTISRRRLLAAGMATGFALAAGCSGRCGSGLPNDGVVATDRTGSVPADATVVEFAKLPPAEQSLLREAVEDGAVRVCMTDQGDRAAAIRSFGERLPVDSSYLTVEGDQYALYVRVEDVVYASTADPPEGDENPCC